MEQCELDSELHVRDVPRIHCDSADRFRAELADMRTPAIVTGIVNEWRAFELWTIDYLRANFGHLRFRVGVRLPVDISPYRKVATDFIEEMSLSDALELISTREEATYVRRQHIEKFPRALADIDVHQLSPNDGRPKNCFVWIGKNTLTGLHFDFTQGLLCQLLGRKQVYLASPRDSRNLAPVVGSVSKSNFLPNRPDFESFPRAREVLFWRTELAAGELLIIPRLWWHSVIAKGISVSINHDFGKNLSFREIGQTLAAGGSAQVARVVRDFVVHGLFNRPFVRNLTDDPPFGKLLYDMVAYTVRSRLPIRQQQI